MRRICFWILAALALFAAPAACGGGGPGGSSTTGGVSPASCLDGMSCVSDDDCKMGTHCNTGLTPPACQVLYCGPLGAPCSEPANCDTGLDCAQIVDSEGVYGDSRCCVPEGEACSADQDCCSIQEGVNALQASCQMGTCARVCSPPGGDCFSNADCCSGNACDPSTSMCQG